MAKEEVESLAQVKVVLEGSPNDWYISLCVYQQKEAEGFGVWALNRS